MNGERNDSKCGLLKISDTQWLMCFNKPLRVIVSID